MSKTVKLYTKTGDKGESSVIGGGRKSKSEPIFEVLGTIDEVNSLIGLSVVVADGKIKKELMRVQDKLLKVGAVVAGSNKVQIESVDVRWLEKRVDYYQKNTRKDWYKKFLLPGGVELSARLDVARAVVRRAERVLVRLESERVILRYINRLSDYLFALRCFVNSKEKYEEKMFNG